jgi:hypothetical protein
MVLLAGLTWLGAVAMGFRLALTYQVTAGVPARVSGVWPASAPCARDAGRATLVLCAHPHCPCTRSTLAELDRLVARCAGRMRVLVLFYADPALGPDWEKSDLWRRASAIPGVEVAADPLGATAELFGAHTSGQVFLFDRDGRLVFEGGITAARGHEGDNAGADSIAEFVTRGVAPVAHTPVFGCGLGNEGQTP